MQSQVKVNRGAILRSVEQGHIKTDHPEFQPGDTVRAGQKLMTLHTDTPERFDRALAALDGGWTIGPAGSTPDLLPLVIDRIAQ